MQCKTRLISFDLRIIYSCYPPAGFLLNNNNYYSPTSMFTSGCSHHPLCSQQAGPLSPVHFQQRSSSEGANSSATTDACYYKPAEAEKKYQNVERYEDVVHYRNSGKCVNPPNQYWIYNKHVLCYYYYILFWSITMMVLWIEPINILPSHFNNTTSFN